MQDPIKAITERFSALIWEADTEAMSGPKRAAVLALRFSSVVVRDLFAGDLTLRAMSLVYTTLLSLVPLTAVSFSVLKGFGVHNQAEPLIRNFLDPLGPNADELTAQFIGLVEGIDVGVLGVVGLALLIYTVVALLQKIEASFNFVWRIDTLRSFGQRFSSYLSTILVGPVLVFTALGMTAVVMNTVIVQRLVTIEPFGTMMVWFTKLVPYLLVWAAFTYIYLFVPNTRVKIRAGAVGGLIAAILWQTSGVIFARFIATSARYTAIYSSFAVVILVLIWLYLNWMILLSGAQFAFYVQNPRYITRNPIRMVLSNRLRERVAVSVMYLVGSSHYRNTTPWTATSLSEHLDLPMYTITAITGLLEQEGYLTETGDDPPGFLPARDIETVLIHELIASVRRAEEKRFPYIERMPVPKAVDDAMTRARKAAHDALGDLTLRDLVVSGTGEEVVGVQLFPGSELGGRPGGTGA